MKNSNDKTVKLTRKRHKMSVFTWVVMIWLILQIALLYVPLMWGVLSSFKDLSDYYGNRLGFPQVWTLDNYRYVIENFYVEVFRDDTIHQVYMEGMLVNTLFYGFGATVAGLAAKIIMAYILWRYKDYKLSSVIKTVYIVTMMIPLSSLASELAFLKRINFFDSIPALIFLRGHPVGIELFIILSGFNSVPRDLTDAAEVDGVSRLGLLLKIMLPAISGIVGLFFLTALIGYWNDYAASLYYLPSHPTIGFGLFYLNLRSNIADYVSYKLAAALLISSPIIVVFSIFGERLMGNISLAEGIKG